MRETFGVLIVVCLAAGAEEAEHVADRIPPLLQPGVYHGDEFPEFAESGQSWLGLVQDEGQYSLVPMKISVATVHDGIVDEAGEMTGKALTVDVAAEVVMLVPIDELEPGPVVAAEDTTVFGTFLYPGQQRRLYAGKGVDDLDYLVYGRVEPHVQKSWATLRILDYGISVVCQDQFGDHVERKIVSIDQASEDGAPRLLFAGDLNRDGHFDLLMDLTTHYNVSHPALFLSRVGSDGAPTWEKVAELLTTGC